MSFIIFLFFISIGAYFLWRRGRGPDQPTVREDLRSLFGFGKRKPKGKRSAADPSVADWDGHAMESDEELTDTDRVTEIMELTDLWNKSDDAEIERPGQTGIWDDGEAERRRKEPQ